MRLWEYGNEIVEVWARGCGSMGMGLSDSLRLSLAASDVAKDVSEGVGNDSSLLWRLLLSLHCEGLPSPCLSICKYCT